MWNCRCTGYLLLLLLQLIKLGTVCQHHRRYWHRHREHFHPARQWKLHPEESGRRCDRGHGSVWGLMLFNFCHFVCSGQGRERGQVQLHHEVQRRLAPYQHVPPSVGISAFIQFPTWCLPSVVKYTTAKYSHPILLFLIPFFYGNINKNYS